MRKRHELNDKQWERLKPILPPQKPRTGRPSGDHRKIINGILWILRTGAPWRDLPEEYGSWSTVYSRFYRWTKAGIWDRIFKIIQEQSNATGKIDWKIQFVDSTIIRAHQHAAGAKGGTQSKRRWVSVKADSAPRYISKQREAAS
jgi:transposase